MCKCTLKMHSSVKRKLMKESFLVTALSFSHCRQIEKKISFMTSMVDISVQLKYKKITSNVSYDKILRFLIKSKYAYL